MTGPVVQNSVQKVARAPLFDRIGWYFLELVGILPEARLYTMQAETILDRAETKIRAQQTDRARELLEHVARRNLEDPRVFERLAQLELRNGNPAAARRSQLRSAQFYLRRGLANEGAAVLRQLLAIHRDCLEARLALGQLAEGRAQTDEAVAQYVEAVKILTARKDWSGAQELVERVRQLQRVKAMLDGVTEISERALNEIPVGLTADRVETQLNVAPVARSQPPPSWQQGPSVWVSPELGAASPSPAPPTRLLIPNDATAVSPPQFHPTPTDIVFHQPPGAGMNIPLATAVEYAAVDPVQQGGGHPQPHAPAPSVFDFDQDVTLRPGSLHAGAVRQMLDARTLAEDLATMDGLPPAPRPRPGSVWDRAVIRVDPQQITLAVEPEPPGGNTQPIPGGPITGGPGILRKTKTGIQNAISGIFEAARPGTRKP